MGRPIYYGGSSADKEPGEIIPDTNGNGSSIVLNGGGDSAELPPVVRTDPENPTPDSRDVSLPQRIVEQFENRFQHVFRSRRGSRPSTEATRIPSNRNSESSAQVASRAATRIRTPPTLQGMNPELMAAPAPITDAAVSDDVVLDLISGGDVPPVSGEISPANPPHRN